MLYKLCPTSRTLSLILRVVEICIAAKSWHERRNDFISSSTCANAYLGSVTRRADCPVSFLFSKLAGTYLINWSAHWETYLSHTSMHGCTRPPGRRTSVVWASGRAAFRWSKQGSALASISEKCAHRHTHTLKRAGKRKVHKLITHSTHGHSTLGSVLLP